MPESKAIYLNFHFAMGGGMGFDEICVHALSTKKRKTWSNDLDTDKIKDIFLDLMQLILCILRYTSDYCNQSLCG